jgi:hypothetical protein
MLSTGGLITSDRYPVDVLRDILKPGATPDIVELPVMIS